MVNLNVNEYPADTGTEVPEDPDVAGNVDKEYGDEGYGGSQ